MTFLLTFACYGWHLPGQEGTIDRLHNLPGGRLPEPRPGLLRAKQLGLKYPAFEIREVYGGIVLESIRETCRYKSWLLLAAHVRSNHVHVVLETKATPEEALNVLKAYASRALNVSCPLDRNRPRWVRHGSTRYLWNTDEISAAVRYVISKQGEPMAVYEAAPRGPFETAEAEPRP